MPGIIRLTVAAIRLEWCMHQHGTRRADKIAEGAMVEFRQSLSGRNTFDRPDMQKRALHHHGVAALQACSGKRLDKCLVSQFYHDRMGSEPNASANLAEVSRKNSRLVVRSCTEG